MERDFSNENMEEFLQRNADGLRMRPSARVWKGISIHLKRRRRRVGLLVGTSLLMMVTLGYYLVNESARAIQQTTSKPAIKREKSVTPISVTSNVTHHLTSSNNQQKRAAMLLSGYPKPDQQFSYTRNLPGVSEEVVAEPPFTPTVVDSYFENA
ncbi:MAG TPA: hypothetical protein VNS32_08715, partial [Flavisolibacter sp.]|nr:hypothetical protein [Flavisolibacter sp.]